MLLICAVYMVHILSLYSTGRWLTPVFDLANHRPAILGGGSLSTDDQGQLLLKAGSQVISCGDEVTFDYQCIDDDLTAATYGFYGF